MLPLRYCFLVLTFLATSLLASIPVSAVQQTQPSPTAGQLRARVTTLGGFVQVRTAEDQPWTPARLGMVVDQGAEFRTGPRSTLTFVIDPDQTVTLDRLTTVKVLQALSDGQKVSTDLGMKYGRTMYEIESAGLRHDARIASPSATMAIRGTEIIYEDTAPFTPSLVSNRGQVEYRNLRRQIVAFGGRQRAKMSAADRSPAQTARRETRVNPQGVFSGRTESEEEQIQSTTASSGLDAAGLRAVQQLRRILGPGDVVGVPDVPGPLTFSLFWQSTRSGKPASLDLNLLVIDPQGRTVSLKNPSVGSGSAVGLYAGDDKGLKGSGSERIEWGLFYPPGRYQIQARNISGGPARTFLSAVRQGRDVATFGFNPKKPLVLRPGATLTRTVTVR